MKNKFIVFEGINACGKQLAVKIAAKFLENQGLKGLDIVKWKKEKKVFPDFEEILKYDFFLTAEPTHAWVGAAIRGEMFFKNDRYYDEKTMMNAYALDRHILYKRLLVPLKNAGKIILQERTISSTLAIQTSGGGDSVSWEDILNHHDHQYVLENLPEYLVVINCNPEFAQAFIEARFEEDSDNDKYENIKRQQNMYEVYNSDKFKEEFEKRGTKVLYIENDSDIKSLEKKVTDLVKKILMSEK